MAPGISRYMVEMGGISGRAKTVDTTGYRCLRLTRLDRMNGPRYRPQATHVLYNGRNESPRVAATTGGVAHEERSFTCTLSVSP